MEVRDKLERGERVVCLRNGDEFAHALRRRVGDDLEEEVEAGVAGTRVGGRVVFRPRHAGALGGIRTGGWRVLVVEAGVEQVEERVGSGGLRSRGGRAPRMTGGPRRTAAMA